MRIHDTSLNDKKDKFCCLHLLQYLGPRRIIALMSEGEEALPVLKRPVTWIAIAIIFALLGIGGVGLYQYKRVQGELTKLKTNPSGPLTDDRQRELIAEVSSRIMLPTDEKPTVAVVSDINRLKDQQFFSGGQNGDVVLIYMNSKKAVLYRPAEKKIVEVAPVNLNNNQASVAGATSGELTQQPQTESAPPAKTQPSPTSLPTPTSGPSKFALRNGTNVTGLARTFEQQLVAKVPGAAVTERGNAAKRDYPSSFIVDVTGKKSTELQTIASALGIAPGSLPAGEPQPSGADFLVIIGADKK